MIIISFSQVFVQNRVPLDQLLAQLRAEAKDLTKELGTDGDILAKAANHADALKTLAKELKDTHQKTEQFAATAMDAAKR